MIDPQTRTVLEFDLVLEAVAGRAASPLGREYVTSIEPVTEMDALERRYAPLRDLITLLHKDQAPPLGGLFDIRPLLIAARPPGAVLEEEHWPRIAAFLQICAGAVEYREHHRSKFSALAGAMALLQDHEDLRVTIARTLDSEGRIRDDASPELHAARRALAAAEKRLQRTVGSILSDLHDKGFLQDNFSTMRSGRHVFPVRASSRGRVPGIMHGSSSTGETVFVEPLAVVEATNEIESLREAERREVWKILDMLTSTLRPFVPLADTNVTVLRHLDGLLAIGRTAVDRAWAIPLVVERGPVRLFNAHHPLLNLRGAKSVPVTMLLDAQDRCVVLSGPNAGGKTTAMKMLGLHALLVQCGLPVPAFPDSQMPLFLGVYADIGDRQDLAEGVSTFSGHIRRIRELWDRAGPRSLVMMDELGTGTDPQEGGAIALSLLESFLGRAALTVTTSHLNPVKAWAEDTPGVRNASFSLDPGTRAPTFRLRIDIPGASEALDISEREGLPAAVLARARQLVGERHLQMGELLRRIEEREQRLAISVREAEARAKSLAEQENIVRARAELLRTERRDARDRAIAEREKTIASLRERFERMIADLPSEEELRRRKEALVRAREELLTETNLAASERRRMAEEQLQRGDFVKGQRVYIQATGQWGEILDLESNGRRARVMVGALQVSLKLDDLLDHDPAERRAEQLAASQDAEARAAGTGSRSRHGRGRKIRNALRNASEAPTPGRQSRVTLSGRTIIQPGSSRPSSMTLDLHGMRVEEALKALDHFLDRSLLAGFPYVRICHGTGTGRLYKAVHEYLRTQPQVRNYRFATPDEGGGGVTIAEF